MAVIRAFKPYTVGTTPQPLVGTTITQAVTASGSAQTVSVADSSMFLNSDTINMNATNQAIKELAIQIQVVDATHVKGIFTKNHASGEYMVLSYPCSNVQVQAVNASPLTASTFLATNRALPTIAGVNCFYDLYLSLYYAGPPGFCNSDNLCNYWIISASGTQNYLPCAVQGD